MVAPNLIETPSAASGGSTLDQAYDQGGPGAGRTINVDAGAVTLTGGGTTVGGLTVNGSRTIASAAAAVWDEVLVDADVSLSGVTNVTTVTGFNLVSIKAPTITDAGTITSVANAATLYVEGPPVGSGLTITNAYSIWVDSGNSRFDGDVTINGKLTVTGAIDPVSLLLSDPAAGTALFIESNNGETAPVSGAATGRIRYNNTTGTWQVSMQGGAYASISTGAGGVTLDGAYDFGGAGVGRTITVDSGAVTFTGGGTTVGGFTVNGSRTIASAAGAVWNEILLDADVSLSGVTNVTTATGFNMVALNAPTITDAGTITSVTNAATLYVAGPPVGSGLTVTNPYSIWVDDGNVRFDATVLLGGATAATTSSIAGNTGAMTLTGGAGGVQRILIQGPAIGGGFHFFQDATTSQASGNFTYNGAAHTDATASTELPDVNWNFVGNYQHATGAITTQRTFVVGQRTYTFAGASTITNGATLAVVGPPIASTNATITTNYAVWIQAGNHLRADGSTTIASAAGAIWNAVLLDMDVSLTGVTNVTTATGFNMVALNAPTITDAGTITSVTNAATFYVGGAPVGSGLTVTNAYSLWIDAGVSRFDARIESEVAGTPAYSFVGGTTTGFGTSSAAIGDVRIFSLGSTVLQFTPGAGSPGGSFTITMPAAAGGGATNSFKVFYNNYTTQTASTEVVDADFDMSGTLQHSTGALTTQRGFVIRPRTYTFVGASTITNAAALAVTGPPVAGTNATITSNYAVWIQAGNHLKADGSTTIASAAGAIWDAIFFDMDATLTGSTNVTTATGFNMVTLNAPTITDGGTITSVTNAATLYIAGPPVGSGLTVTNPYALWVDAGNARFDGVIYVDGGSSTALSYSSSADPTSGFFAGTQGAIMTARGTAVGTYIDIQSNLAGSTNLINFLMGDSTSGAGSNTFKFTGGSHTTQAAGVEVIDLELNFVAVVEHSTGALATQRSVVVRARNYSFVGASTITSAATMAIVGSPTAGTNATITSALAFWVAAAGTGSFNTYFGATPSMGGGIGCIGIANAGTNPSSNPTGGGILYANAGAGTWRGSGGTVTAFGPAGPHCEECGYDEWTVATLNTIWKSWRFECGHCGAVYSGGPTDVRAMLPEEHRHKIISRSMAFEEIEKLVA